MQKHHPVVDILKAFIATQLSVSLPEVEELFSSATIEDKGLKTHISTFETGVALELDLPNSGDMRRTPGHVVKHKNWEITLKSDTPKDQECLIAVRNLNGPEQPILFCWFIAKLSINGKTLTSFQMNQIIVQGVLFNLPPTDVDSICYQIELNGCDQNSFVIEKYRLANQAVITSINKTL